MNKIIPFNQIIKLPETVDEITKISLDDTLSLEDPYTIKGNLTVGGSYRILDKETDFSYPLPVEIAIDDKYDTSKCLIKVDDFYYELINGESLRVKIDLILDELFYKESKIKKEKLVLEDNRSSNLLETQSLKTEDEIKESKEQVSVATNSEEKTNSNKIDDLFKETNDSKEYSIYRIYTVLENETLEYIMDKYNVTKEDLASYNNLDDLHAGSKLIIPNIDE